VEGGSQLVSRSRLLSKLEPVVKDPFLLRLISSFLELPIIGTPGKDWSEKRGRPPVHFITPVLFHFYLGELDGAFETSFPHFPYARYDSEVYIPIIKRISFRRAEGGFAHELRNLLFQNCWI